MNFILLADMIFPVMISILVFFPRILDITQLRFSFVKISVNCEQCDRLNLHETVNDSIGTNVCRAG